jgi:hypothetical protein
MMYSVHDNGGANDSLIFEYLTHVKDLRFTSLSQSNQMELVKSIKIER